MRLFALFAIVLLAAAPTRADLAVRQPSTDEWGAPEVALSRRARGRDDALVVVYASGRVLYRDQQGGEQPFDYLLVTLTPAEKCALIDGLPLKGGADWGSGGTDCYTYFLDSWSSGQRRRDHACGWPDDKMTPPIWDRLDTFASPRAKRWVPKVTVTIVSSSLGGASPSIEWPQRWPTHGVPIRWFGRDGWTFVVDGSELPELRRVEAQRADNTWGMLPLLVPDGRYMEMFFDYALPHEDAWRRK